MPCYSLINPRKKQNILFKLPSALLQKATLVGNLTERKRTKVETLRLVLGTRPHKTPELEQGAILVSHSTKPVETIQNHALTYLSFFSAVKTHEKEYSNIYMLPILLYVYERRSKTNL